MRELCGVFFLVALLTASLRADMRQLVQTTIDGHKTIYAEYLRGGNRRILDFGSDSVRRPVMIENFERKMKYLLDMRSREYVEMPPHSPGLLMNLALWIARPPRVRESGKTVNIFYEAVDTGERKEFFGRTAKQFILRERYVAEPGACEQTRQSESHGWYIPAAEPRPAERSWGLVAFTNGVSCQDKVVRHGNPLPPGLAIFTTDGSMTRQVLELSTAPLDNRLFEVPAGFMKVDALHGELPVSWSSRMEMEWVFLERAFESWFE